jgi:hypothetical protein
MRKRLGCVSVSGIIAAFVALLLVVGVSLLWGGVLFSPGPLNAQTSGATLGSVSSHAELGRRCSACHAAPWSRETMSERCLACHTEVARQLQEPSSLHGVLGVGSQGLLCYDCHPEHGGTDAPLTQVDVETFPHEATGYALQGHRQTAAGDEFACADCHGQNLTRFDVAACTDCHRELDAAYTQTHIEAFGPGCLACHDGVDTYGRQFDHDRLNFPLQGQHTSAGCAGCHEGARSIADLQAAPHDCASCHAAADAHEGQFGQDCAGCHTPQDWGEATFDHALTAFPLTGAHIATECRSCHVSGVFAGTPQACSACHDDPAFHLGLLGSDCAACHTTGAWSPARYDRLHTFPYNHGESGPSPCRTCHPDALSAYTCYNCHEHNPAEIEEEHRDEGIADFQDCVGCHPTGLKEEGEGGDD